MKQEHNKATIITVLGSVLAISVPVLLSLQIARNEAIKGQYNIAMTYARDVLSRSEETADEIVAGVSQLQAALANNPDPCSPDNIAVMKRVDLGSKYIQTIGRMEGTLMVCSSLEAAGEAIDLGPADQEQENGVRSRTDVVLPYAPGTTFLVTETQGYAAIIHKSLPIDVTTSSEDVSLATLSGETHRILTSRGTIRPEWANALQDRGESTFRDAEYIVATVASERYNIGAIAAVPARELDARVRDIAVVMLPVGIGGGILLALTVFYLTRQQLAMPAVIRTALKRNEFFLSYQPIIDLHSGQCYGAEVLVRWRRANGEMVRPDIFIPAAEDCGLIQRITWRVLDLLEDEVYDLFRQYPAFQLGINLSSIDLRSANIVDRLRQFCKRLGVSPQRITVEATERGFMHADEARNTIFRLREEGIRVAIDDFGTGYSSLSYLETFDFDALKIDKSFIDSIGSGSATSNVVPHIIQMAKDLDLVLVAEGVETEAQVHFLRERGVHYAQGWYFARPKSLEELLEYLGKH